MRIQAGEQAVFTSLVKCMCMCVCGGGGAVGGRRTAVGRCVSVLGRRGGYLERV